MSHFVCFFDTFFVFAPERLKSSVLLSFAVCKYTTLGDSLSTCVPPFGLSPLPLLYRLGDILDRAPIVSVLLRAFPMFWYCKDKVKILIMQIFR